MTEQHQITVNEARYVDQRAGSDKFYRTFALGPLWLVQYGRNGQIGTFTKPVDAGSPEKAVAAAAKKFAAKIKKGYTPSRSGVVSADGPLHDLTWLDTVAAALPASSGDGLVGHEPVAHVEIDLAPAQDVTDEVVGRLRGLGDDPVKTSGEPLRPMLAESVDEAGFLELVADDDWVAQYKYDGDRLVIVVDDGRITVLNRQGQAKVRGVSAELLKPFTALHRGRWVFDGELVDRVLVLFDMIAADVADLDSSWVGPDTPFSRRYQVLGIVLGTILDPQGILGDQGVQHTIARTFVGPVDKLAAYTSAKAERREGLILRDRQAPYQQGRRSAHLLKRKFTHTADVVVTHLATDKDSASLAVLDPSIAEAVTVGSASTIGKGPVHLDEVWEVEFLYVVDPAHPRMVQPRLVRRREDKAPGECLIDQFQNAGTDRTV